MRWGLAALFLAWSSIALVLLGVAVFESAFGSGAGSNLLGSVFVLSGMSLLCFAAAAAIVFPEHRLSRTGTAAGALVAGANTLYHGSAAAAHGGRLLWGMALASLAMTLGAVGYLLFTEWGPDRREREPDAGDDSSERDHARER